MAAVRSTNRGTAGQGAEDHVIPPTFPDECKVAFTECVGPFVVPGAGHFRQWEQPAVLNRALTRFLAGLRRCG